MKFLRIGVYFGVVDTRFGSGLAYVAFAIFLCFES
jgi:hypothetical protein